MPRVIFLCSHKKKQNKTKYKQPNISVYYITDNQGRGLGVGGGGVLSLWRFQDKQMVHFYVNFEVMK